MKKKMSMKKKSAAAYCWKPKPLTKQQKAMRALRSHHRAERIDVKCRITTCHKHRAVDSDCCPQHRSLLVVNVPRHLEINVYGE